LLIAALGAALVTNVQPVRADVHYKQAWLSRHQTATDYAMRGEMEDADRLYEDAIREYERAISLAPTEDFYFLFEGKALLEWADGLAQRVEEARTASAAPEAIAGLELRRDEKYSQALEVLLHAQQLSPLNPDHTANLGRYYQVRGERETEPAERKRLLEKSLQYLRQAIELSPNSAQLYDHMGSTYMLMEEYDKAIEHLEEALRIDPKYALPYRTLGDVYRAMEDWQQCAESIERYVEAVPRDIPAKSALAFCYTRDGRINLAIEQNLAILGLAPDNLQANRNLGLLYHQQGDAAKALEHLRKARELAGEDPQVDELIRSLEGEIQSSS
jgi:tetratricopeptide (TPR) repeat protein